MAGLAQRARDGLRNVLSGLGVAGQDKTPSAHYFLDTLSRQEIDACYRTTWLGRKIHDIPAKDMTREWRGWQADDNQIEAIEKEEKRLQLVAKTRRALILSRLYGGAVMILGLPGDARQPAPAVIRKGELRYVHVMHRHEITLGDQVRNLNDPLFGLPSSYRLQSNVGIEDFDLPVHPSRVIPFISGELPDQAMGFEMQGWFWGDPLLYSIKDALKSHDTTVAAITALLNEAKVDVVHIPGLMDSLASTEYEGKLIQRLNIAALIKSITNTLVLDGGDDSGNGGEKWETRQMKFEGLPDIQKEMFMLVSGAADIPATRLIGQAPHGLNSTGESDTRNYYDMLASMLSSDLTPALAPLDEYLIMSATGARDPSIYYEWNPLWQMTPKETADRDWLLAQTTEKYANIGAIPSDAFAVAVQNRLIEDGTYPGLEAAIEEAELEAEMAAPPPEPAITLNPLDPNAPPAPKAPPPPANDPMVGNSKRRAANDRARKRIRRAAAMDRAHIVADAVPRPLFVSRKVLNGDEIVAWARAQGFKEILAASDMHVTITASREPVDWLKVGGDGGFGGDNGELKINPGGPRVVEPLGQAVVLLFNSWELSYRHDCMAEQGASWDFAEYQPHISISYDREANAGLDLQALDPFTGAIRLGPEIFEEFKETAIAEA